MEHIEPSSTSQPFINEVLSPLNLDCYSCNFGPVGIAELEQSLGSPAVIVEQNRQFEIIPELKHAKFFGFFDRGSVQIPEDIALISLPFMAAFDGTSGVFYNGGPQKILYETGITGGQMAIKLAAEKFCSAEPTQTVLDILNQANSAIAHEHQLAGLNLSFGGTLGGAVGAAVKLSSPSVKIVQFGDGVVIWELKDGSTGMMGNQTRIHEIEMLATIASLMERLAQEYPGAALPFLRSRMWEVFGPFLLEKRNERINNLRAGGYGFLCGQESFSQAITTTELPISELKTLILASDGLVPFEETGDPELLAHNTIKRFNAGGFESVIAHQREHEQSKFHSSHVSNAEAVGVAIKF